MARGGGLGVWVGLSVLVLLLPFILVGMIGSMELLWDSLGVGLGLLVLLALARSLGRRAASLEARPRWQPALVALISLLPTAVWVFRNRYLLAWDTHFREQLLGLPAPYENFGGVGDHLPALILVPVALLTFLVLCRVAALDLPMAFGVARGLRQTASAAVGLLVAVSSLVGAE